MENLKAQIAGKKKIGILGGTFNPPHYGHMDIAEAVYHSYGLDTLLLLPVGMPPHKKKVASKKDRLHMTELLAKERSFFQVCTIEIERRGYTYTIDTLGAFHEAMDADAEIYYIIGTDTLLYMHSWRDFAEVLPLATFVCVMRPGEQKKEVDAQVNAFRATYGKEILLSSHVGPAISSTMVREAAKEGLPLEKYVPRSIARYIEEQKIYD
ncbi:MAG: nicotinate-nucleotide adenylyltransferase [Christensenellaceae bacterium]|jgi:nicotinate-nucleotide adenylyltransferase